MLQPNLGAIIVVTPCIWTFSSEVKPLGYGVRVSKSFSLKNSKIHQLVWGKNTYLVLKYMSNSNLVCAFENLIRNFSVNYNFDFETFCKQTLHCYACNFAAETSIPEVLHFSQFFSKFAKIVMLILISWLFLISTKNIWPQCYTTAETSRL